MLVKLTFEMWNLNRGCRKSLALTIRALNLFRIAEVASGFELE